MAVDPFDDKIYVGGFNYATSFIFSGKVVANNGISGTGNMTLVVYSKDGNELWAKVCVRELLACAEFPCRSRSILPLSSPHDPFHNRFRVLGEQPTTTRGFSLT